MRKRTLNRITLINILSTILLQGISFISAPIISRLLGTSNYGTISIYYTWVSVATILFSVQTHSTMAVAKTRFKEDEQAPFQSSILTISLLFFAIGSIIIILFLEPLANLLKLHTVMLMCIMLHAYGQYCVEFLNTKFTYDFEAEKNLYLSIFVSLGIFLLSLLFIGLFPQSINYWGRILAFCIIYGALGIGISIYFFSRGKLFFCKRYWKFAFPLSVPIVVHGLSGIILGQCDRVMIQQMFNTSMVGIYSLTAAFGGILSTIYCALNDSWVPFLYAYLKDNKTDEITYHGKNYMELYSVLTIGFMLLAPEVFRLFASREYWSGVSIIPVFALNAFFDFLYSFPVNYEFYYQKTRAIAWGTFLAGICNIILNLILIPLWQTTGAALATMLSNALVFLFHYGMVTKIVKCSEYPFKMATLLPYMAVVGAVAFVVSYCGTIWWIRWCAGALVGCWELYRMIKRKSIF